MFNQHFTHSDFELQVMNSLVFFYNIHRKKRNLKGIIWNYDN